MEYGNLIENTVKKIRSMDRENKIIFMIIYGSYIENRFHKGSDIDLCLYYDDNRLNRQKFRLKLLSEINDIFDIQIFQDLPLYIRNDVIHGKILYYQDEAYDIIRNTADEFEDFKRGYYDIIGLEKIK